MFVREIVKSNHAKNYFHSIFTFYILRIKILSIFIGKQRESIYFVVPSNNRIYLILSYNVCRSNAAFQS